MSPKRPQDDRTGRPSGGFGAGPDGYRALLDVLESEARRAEATRALRTRRPDGRARLLAGLLAALVALSAWLWLAPPAWVAGGSVDQPLAEEEASLRFAMYLQAQRLEAYRDRTGTPPPALEHAGPPMAGMEYRLLDDEVYELTGRTDRVRLVYRSDQPLERFLGPGARALERGADPEAADGS